MRDMWGEKSCGRTRFNAFTITLVIMLICAILGTTIFFNWKYIVQFFKDTKNKVVNWFKKDESVRVIDDNEYAKVGDEEFDNLFERVFKLEQLSKEYSATKPNDKTDYRLRALIYLRSCKYKSDQWNLGGVVDQDFIAYVDEHEGDANDISSFRPLNEGTATETLTEIEFTVPGQTDKVDFYHLFATLNMNFNNGQNAADLSGWAGDLVELMATIDNDRDKYIADNSINPEDVIVSGKNALVVMIENKFDKGAGGGFGSTDVCADFDAVNIIKNYKNQTTTSLVNTIARYYKSITKTTRISLFVQNNFNSTNVANLKDEIFDRMLNGTTFNQKLIVILANTKAVTISKQDVVAKYCVEVFADYLL